MANVLDQWARHLPVLYATLGESVTWHSQGGEDSTVTALIDRTRRGDVDTADGLEETQVDGTITVVVSDVTGGPAEGDTVTAATYPGSSSTEVLAVGPRVRDHENGSVTHELWGGSGRRYGGPDERM